MATNTTNFNLKKPAYTDTADIADINGNMDKVDVSLNGLADAIAIVANGNTHAAITAGQYVYVHGHGSLAEGLYTAKSNISANATLSTSNLQADGSGGLNALNSKIANQTQSRQAISGQDVLSTSLAAGLYYVTGAVNVPTSGKAGYLDVTDRDGSSSTLRVVKWRVFDSNDEYLNVLPNSGTWKGWESYALNSKLPTVSAMSKQTASIAVGGSSSITLDLPSTYTRIIGIEVCADPDTHYQSFLVFRSVYVSGGVNYYCAGSGNAQTFTMKYNVIYIP